MQFCVRLQRFLLCKSQMSFAFCGGSNLCLPQLYMSSARVWGLLGWGCDILVRLGPVAAWDANLKDWRGCSCHVSMTSLLEASLLGWGDHKHIPGLLCIGEEDIINSKKSLRAGRW